MEEDKLKRFIEDNQEEFDLEMPSDKVWTAINQQMNPKRKNNSWMIWSAAASVVILLTVGFYFRKEKNIEPQVVEKPEVQDPVMQQVQEMEVFYASQINEKVEEAKKFEDSEELLEEVDLLKEEYESLKEEMEVGANREVVLEAMIDNYRFRLQILEDLLKELKEDKNPALDETDI